MHCKNTFCKTHFPSLTSEQLIRSLSRSCVDGSHSRRGCCIRFQSCEQAAVCMPPPLLDSSDLPPDWRQSTASGLTKISNSCRLIQWVQGLLAPVERRLSLDAFFGGLFNGADMREQSVSAVLGARYLLSFTGILWLVDLGQHHSSATERFCFRLDSRQ